MTRKGWTVGLGLALVLTMSAGACPAAETVTGTVKDKYIEDFTEPTVVVQEADGDVHHFTIEMNEWRRVQVGQQFTNTQSTTDDD